MPSRFERVAVLGATGPTGRALTAQLQTRDVPTRVVSRRRSALEAAFPGERIEKRQGDALDPASLQAALSGCDLVVDCIGLPSDQMASHPTVARNLAFTLQSSGAKCLQVSSYWCYIPIAQLPVSESHPRTGGPPWARHRREAEDILRQQGAAIVHLPDFFGPHVHTSSLQRPIQNAVAGKAMGWIGPASVQRDYAFVPDAMRIVAELVEHPEAFGEDWIVPGSGPLSGDALGRILSSNLGRDVQVRAAGAMLLRILSLFDRDLRGFLQLLPTYTEPISYDGSKLESLLGNLHRTPYERAIAETVSWIRSTGKS